MITTILWCLIVAWLLFAWRGAMHMLFYLIVALFAVGAITVAVMFWPVTLPVAIIAVGWQMAEHLKARRA